MMLYKDKRKDMRRLWGNDIGEPQGSLLEALNTIDEIEQRLQEIVDDPNTCEDIDGRIYDLLEDLKKGS